MAGMTFEEMTVSLKEEEEKNPRIEKRIKTFNVKEGMTVVDYGCGPGMYIKYFSSIVGKNGKVFAVDINENAKDYVEKVIKENKINNVVFCLADEYNCKIEAEISDIVFALDVLHKIENQYRFLLELNRICKKNGIIILDDGHQSRTETKMSLEKIVDWKIKEETEDHIKLTKK